MSIIIFIIGVLAMGYLGYAMMFGKLNQTEKFVPEKMNISHEMLEREADSGIINIALFGLDQREHGFDGNVRSDAMKIISIDTVQSNVKITSVQRDLLVIIPDDEVGLDKLNHAYWYGGAELALKTLNQNLDLDLTRYVSVNYDAIEALIDHLGGVEVQLLKAEVRHLNDVLYDLNRLAGIDLDTYLVEEGGLQVLNGRQALAYMRIRNIGSDYARMRRQTRVIEAVAKQLQKLNYGELMAFIQKGLQYVQTNLQNDEIISLIPLALKVDFNEIESYQLPTNDFDETISTTYKGYEPVYLLQDYVKLASDAHENIYGYYKDSEMISHQHDMIYEIIEGL